jgi:hypothetical protein
VGFFDYGFAIAQDDNKEDIQLTPRLVGKAGGVV